MRGRTSLAIGALILTSVVARTTELIHSCSKGALPDGTGLVYIDDAGGIDIQTAVDPFAWSLDRFAIDPRVAFGLLSLKDFAAQKHALV